MDWLELGMIIGVPTIAAVIAGIFTNWIGLQIMWGNRQGEWQENRDTPPPSEGDMRWQITHIRDDLGSLFGAICVTNGLLSAIAAAVILRLFLN